jgi:hypothetical protein
MERNKLMAEFEVKVSDDTTQVLLPNGEIFEVVYLRHEANRCYYSQLKLYIYFKIVTPGKYYGIEIYRVYNQYRVPNRNSDFIKDCELILGRRLKKNEKASTAIFKKKVLRIRVRTVKKNRKQEQLPDFQQYSVIDSILEVVTGVLNDIQS